MLKYLIEKEFKQLKRNSFIPRILIIMPLMMMLVMPWAANQEVKDIKLSIVDNDHSSLSRRLIQKTLSSGYFRLTDLSQTYNSAMESIESCSADIILSIPPGFEKSLIKEGQSDVLISANAVNGTKGTIGGSYIASVMTDFADDMRSEYGLVNIKANGNMPVMNINTRYKFNPLLDYKVFMVPALMVMLLTMLAGFLPALNIVGEKEAGTIEQINVTPVKKIYFVLAKLIPYWLIGFAILSFCMLLAALVYGIYPEGSILTIYLFTSIYILVVSGMGLVISNYSETIQQAMFVMYFFMMILLLMSGLFTPVSSMPQWAQLITSINPLKYFIQVMRMVYLKGSSITELTTQFVALCSFAAVLNTWAVLSYKKSN